MKAVLREIMSSDVDLRQYDPDPEDFYVGVTISVGPENEIGIEYFQIEVCSLEWLYSRRGVDLYLDDTTDCVWTSRPLLVMKKYSFEKLHNFLRNFVGGMQKKDWKSIAQEINKFALWEFDQYKP